MSPFTIVAEKPDPLKQKVSLGIIMLIKKKKKDDSLMKNSLDCFMSVLLPIKCFEHLSKYKKKKKPRPYDLQQCLRNT